MKLFLKNAVLLGMCIYMTNQITLHIERKKVKKRIKETAWVPPSRRNR